MDVFATTKQKLAAKKVCVVIPTYNNQKTLPRVLNDVLQYTNDVLVVNDGSTDQTKEILKTYPQVRQIHFAKNKGKGVALQKGFQNAVQGGFHFAITIDSDGQHFASDIPVFINALEKEHTPVLLIGDRNMKQEGVPGKSSFGNRFSNFWFWFETGIRLQDTQSGFRLYPLKELPKKFYTTKFEFEIEVIVRAAWKGIPVKNVPIRVLYDPGERVSHFRPFTDFARISVLNTVLVFLTLLYIKPRDFYKNFKKKSFASFFKEDILSTKDSNPKKALSIALGVFIGLSPFWGFQTVLVLSLAVFLQLNKALSFAASNISVPPLIPIILYLSLQIGGWFVVEKADLSHFNEAPLAFLKGSFTQYVIGSLVLATFAAVFFGLGSYLLLSLLGKPANKT